MMESSIAGDDDTIANLQTKIQEMETEIESLRSSRNYYKDQCESLLLSLSNTVQKQTPAYRTQEEVEEMIEAIQSQQSEKRRKLKEKMDQERGEYKVLIEQLNYRISEKDKMLQEQDDARTSLIEKLMAYKKMLKESQELQQKTEMTISQLQATNESLLQEQRQISITHDSQIVDELQASHATETNMLKKQIAKLTKKLKYVTNSLSLCQTAQEESNADLNDLTVELANHQELVKQLKAELQTEKKRQEDATGLLKLAFTEAQHFQADSERAAATIAELANEIQTKDAEIQKMNDDLLVYIVEAGSNKAALDQCRRDAVEMNLQVEEIKLQLQMEKDLNIDLSEKHELQVKEMKAEIKSLNSQITDAEKMIDEYQKNTEKLQSQTNQEIRLRKAAELARDTALTNLKNAYTLMNSSETSRHEVNIEIEKLNTELEERAQEITIATQQIEERDGRINQLEKDLSDARDEVIDLRERLDKESLEVARYKRDYMPIRDAEAKIRRVENEREKLQSEINILNGQYQSLQAENDTKQEALEHQTETISKIQEEARNLTKTNRKLRARLRQGGVATTTETFTESEILEPRESDCHKCEAMSEQLDILKSKSIKSEQKIVALENANEQLEDVLSDMFAKLANIAETSESNLLMSEAHEVSQVLTSDVPMDKKLSAVANMSVSLIDNVVGSRNVPSQRAESKLLKSTISHMEMKIASLQAQNRIQNEEILNLRENVDTAYRNKEQYEQEMLSLNQSLASLRVNLDSTKRKLGESERARKQLQSELTMVKLEQQEISAAMPNSSVIDSASDDDISDISSVSSRSNGINYTPSGRQSRVTALSDSLALLDLLCQ